MVISWYLWAIYGLRSHFFTPWNHQVLDVWTDFGALGAVHCRPGKAWRVAPASSRWNCVTRNSSQKPMVFFFSDLCLMFVQNFWRSLRKLEACELQKSCCWRYFTWPSSNSHGCWVIRQKTIQGKPNGIKIPYLFKLPKITLSFFFPLIVFSGGELPVDKKCEFTRLPWVWKNCLWKIKTYCPMCNLRHGS